MALAPIRRSRSYSKVFSDAIKTMPRSSGETRLFMAAYGFALQPLTATDVPSIQWWKLGQVTAPRACCRAFSCVSRLFTFRSVCTLHRPPGENPIQICAVPLKSLINPTKKHDRNHPGRPDENDTPSSNLLVVLLVLLASRDWKAGSAGNHYVNGWCTTEITQENSHPKNERYHRISGEKPASQSLEF